MFDHLVAHMRDAITIDRTGMFNEQVEVPAWIS
jgi:hypothetical protein